MTEKILLKNKVYHVSDKQLETIVDLICDGVNDGKNEEELDTEILMKVQSIVPEFGDDERRMKRFKK